MPREIMDGDYSDKIPLDHHPLNSNSEYSSRNPFADSDVLASEEDFAEGHPFTASPYEQVSLDASDPFANQDSSYVVLPLEDARTSAHIQHNAGYDPGEASDLSSYQPYYEDPFVDRAVDDSYAESTYTADVSRRQSKKVPSRNGAPGFYDRVKMRMGFGPKYSDMDLPLAETGAAFGTIDGDPIRAQTATAVSQFEDSSGAGDFDIRKIFNKILRRKPIDPSTLGPRIIYLNDAPANKTNGYLDNHISTTKYNIATFLPKFLFEQFSKYSNLFFLFTCIIQQVPDVSPTNRWTTIITLGIVLSVSAVKEGIEDVKRRNADKDLNNAPVLVFKNGGFETRRWVNVAVGDIVRVESEESIPADLILLASSEPEGLCYIETANLDGETNLKIKQGLTETADRVSPADLGNMKGTIKSEQPNSSLYTFEGTITLSTATGEKEVALNPDQLLLRGATLRNTPWIHGVVVFTGHETKLMRNASAAPIKRTAVEHMVNLQIIFLFGILITLSLVSTIGDVVKENVSQSELGYLYIEGRSMAKLFFQDILTYWILYSNLVPISMFVTIEVVKFYQAYLISSDLDMYYKPTDTPTICRTSSLVEELGQIEYIFSDKTGTLTRNIMEFKQCSIAGICYGDEIPEDRRAVEVDGQMVGIFGFDVLNQNLDNHPTKDVIHEFLTLLSTCHTVIPEIKPDEEKIKYQAASPDEGALVDGAARLGYQFTTRRPKSITVNERGRDNEYELLNICEFNSTRKRMSAIFRCPDGRIRLYCKGADTVILERLSPGNPYVESTLQHLEEYAADGLRTLCLAMRAISDDEYAEWSAIYDRAATTMNNRSVELDKAAELIEKDLFLLGATAIEDKLQDGVPDTIHTLQTAGIKIWYVSILFSNRFTED